MKRRQLITLLLAMPSLAFPQLWTLPPLEAGWTPPVVVDGTVQSPNQLSVASDKTGNSVSVWVTREDHPDPSIRSVLTAYTAYSSDYGQTWSSPTELVNSPPGLTFSVDARNVAAGSNGHWMAAVVANPHNPPFIARHGVVLSTDNGHTWSDFIDLNQQFPVTEEDPAHFARLKVGYCGGSNWIVIQSTVRVIRYARTTDNGATWEPTVVLQNQNPRSHGVDIQSHPGSEAVMIAYHDYHLPPIIPTGEGLKIVRFSHDNGATFGPPFSAIGGGTDGNGNWVIASDWTYDQPMTIRISRDDARTFHEAGALPPFPPHIPVRTFTPSTMAFSDDENLIITGTLWWNANGFSIPIPGATTISTDSGQTWSPWGRIQPDTGDIPTQALAPSQDGFISIMAGAVESSPTPAVYSRRFHAADVTASKDWQLFQ